MQTREENISVVFSLWPDLPSLPPAKRRLEDTAQTLSFWENLGAPTPVIGSVVPKRFFGDLQRIVLSELADALNWQRRRETITWNKMLSPGKNKEKVSAAGLPAECNMVLKNHPVEK